MNDPPIVAVLAYHELGDAPPGEWNDWFYVRENTFAEHLRLLADEAWSVISLDRLIDGLDDPAVLDPRSALITFDDAHSSVRTIGLPLLAQFGFPAAVFVPTNFIGGENRFADPSQPPARLCSWDDLRELANNGVSVQPHSASHRRFSELDAVELEDELARSKDVLECGLGTRVDALAYPYGDSGRDPELARALADRGYRVAFLYGGDCPGRIDDLPRYHFPRLPVGRDTDLAFALGTRGRGLEGGVCDTSA